MSFNVYSLILPLSACCTVLGLSTADFGKLQHIYCITFAVSMFILRTVSIVIRLCTMEVTFVNVMLLITGILTTVTMVHYSIKFVFTGNVTRAIIIILDNVERSLESVGVKVPHTKDHITCYVTIILTVSCRLILTQLLFSNKKSAYIQKGFKSANYSTFRISVSFIQWISVTSLEFYVYVSLYAFQRRLSTFHSTIMSFNYLRNTAWSASSTRRVNIAEERQLCRKLYLIYCSLTDVYLSTKQFYGNFVRFQLISFIIVPSLHLLYTLSQNDHYSLILLLLDALLTQALPLWLCATIKSKLDKI